MAEYSLNGFTIGCSTIFHITIRLREERTFLMSGLAQVSITRGCL